MFSAQETIETGKSIVVISGTFDVSRNRRRRKDIMLGTRRRLNIDGERPRQKCSPPEFKNSNSEAVPRSTKTGPGYRTDTLGMPLEPLILSRYASPNRNRVIFRVWESMP